MLRMDYDSVLQGKYPAKAHARRVADYIRSKIPGASGILYLESGSTKLHEDCDQDEPFRYVRCRENPLDMTTDDRL